jgi:hypothetical protein
VVGEKEKRMRERAASEREERKKEGPVRERTE